MTKREKDLLNALEAAINTYQFASMTSYERKVCAEDMETAEKVHAKYSKELKNGNV